jgi:hypothetical protein
VLNGDEDDKENVKFYVQKIREGGYDISAESVVETGKPRHQADEENVDDAYGKGKSTFNALFSIEGIIHEVEQEDILYEFRKLNSDDDKIDMLFG